MAVLLVGCPSKHAKVSVWRTENCRQPNSKRGKLKSTNFRSLWFCLSKCDSLIILQYNYRGSQRFVLWLGYTFFSPYVHVSWGWRMRMSSRFIKNRLVDFGMIKPAEFLSCFFPCLFCMLFWSYVVRIFLFCFEPSGSKLTLSGLPWVSGGRWTQPR